MSISRTGEAQTPSTSTAERLRRVGFEMRIVHITRELVRADELVAAAIMLRSSGGNGHAEWIKTLSDTLGAQGGDSQLTKLLADKRREFLGLLGEANLGIVYSEQSVDAYARRLKREAGPEASPEVHEFLDHLSEYLELCRGRAQPSF